MWDRDGYWRSLLVIASVIAGGLLVKAESPGGGIQSVNWILPDDFTPGSNQTVTVTTNSSPESSGPRTKTIILGQRVPSGPSSSSFILLSSTVIDINCDDFTDRKDDGCTEIISVQIPPLTASTDTNDFFFCVGSDAVPSTCELGSVSPAFNLAISDAASAGAASGVNTISEPSIAFLTTAPATASPVLVITQIPESSSSLLSSVTSTTASTSSASITSMTSTASSLSTSATVEPIRTIRPTDPTPSTFVVSDTGSERNDGGLSRSARLALILGLAIGGSLIIGLALFFFLRRRKTRRRNALGSGNSSSQPEHMMLTQDSQNEHDNDAEHDQEQEMSQAVNHATTHSKDGVNTNITALERGLSVAIPNNGGTTHDSASRSDTETQTDSREISSPTSFTRPYRDHDDSSDAQPVYGDTRHTPQIFTSPCPPDDRDSSVPASRHFLGEEGMSQEEIERLEEEERRIDAAIAEAESRERRRDS